MMMDGSFQVKLVNLAQELTTHDVSAIKLCCKGKIGAAKLEEATNPMELLDLLQESEILTDENSLRQLMSKIGKLCNLRFYYTAYDSENLVIWSHVRY